MNIMLRTRISAIIALFLLITVQTVFLVFSRFFNEILIYYLGIFFAFDIFLFFLYFSISDSKKASLKIKPIYAKIFLYFLVLISICLVLLIPPYNGSVFELGRIPLTNWLRYFSSLLLTSFFPGYFLLKIIDRKDSIGGAALIVLSYLLSVFTMFVIGFLILSFEGTIKSFAIPAIIGLNLALITIYYLIRAKENKEIELTIKFPETVLLLSILATSMAGFLAIMVYNFPLTPGDMWTHHGIADQYRSSFPVYGSHLIPSYPYLFHIYLACLFSLSGFPSILAEHFLYTLSFLPFLAFYAMVKEWFQDVKYKNMAIIAAFLSIFLGFGLFYALYLGINEPTYNIRQILWTATAKTYDIYLRVLYLPDIVAPIWQLGLPIFFMLLYLLKKCDSELRIGCFLIAILVAEGYLGHVAEIIIFVSVFALYCILFRKQFSWKIGVSILVGLLLVAVFDLIAPIQIYLTTNNYKYAFATLFTAVVTGAMFISSKDIKKELVKLASSPGIGRVRARYKSLKDLQKTKIGDLIKVPMTVKKIAKKIKEVICDKETVVKSSESLSFPEAVSRRDKSAIISGWKYLRWGLLYFYLLCIAIWLVILSDYNAWTYGGAEFVPFFIFPLRFGAVGLLAVLTIMAYFPKILRDKNLLFFLLITIIGFIGEQLSKHNPDFYWSNRYATFTFIGLTIIAAYGIKEILIRFAEIHKTKKVLMGTFLLFILIPSALSTSLYFTHASYYSNREDSISYQELEALDFIKDQLSPNESVLSFTSDSSEKLEAFSGVNQFQDAFRWVNHLLSTSNPYVVTYILGQSNVRYIYLSQEDDEVLDAENGIFNSFLQYFPVVFENEYVSIYEVPLLCPQSLQSSVGVLYFSSSLYGAENLSWVDDSFEEGWKKYLEYGSVKDFDSDAKDGIFKVWFTSDKPGNSWVGYAYEDLSLNTSVSSVFSLRYKVENDYTWLKVQLWNSSDIVFYYTGLLKDKEWGSKTFILPANQTITRVHIIVETAFEAPKDTTATAYLDYVRITSLPFSIEDVPVSLFNSLLNSSYSLLSVDETVYDHLGFFIENYSHIIVTSDPLESSNELLDWISDGHNLVVFNTHGNGFLASLIGLNNSSTEKILNVKSFGSGKIVYVNLAPLQDSRRLEDILRPDFISSVKTFASLPSIDVQKLENPPVYDSNFGDIEVNGSLNILTDVLTVRGTISINEPNQLLPMLAEIKVLGRSNLIINDTTLLISPSESSIMFESKDRLVDNLKIIIRNSNAIVEVRNLADNSTIDIDSQEFIEFNATELFVRTRPIRIQISGEVLFDSLDVPICPYNPFAGIVQQKAKIYGNIDCGIMYISTPIIFYSKFLINGEIYDLSKEETRQLIIPWDKVLFSSYNILFTLIVLLGVFYTIFEDRKFKINFKAEKS